MSRFFKKSPLFLNKDNGLKAKLVQGGLGLGSLKIISMPIGLAISIVMARGLGVETYGTYTYVLSLVSLLALPAYAGLPALLVREVSKYHQSQNYALLNGLTKRAHYLVLTIGAFIMIMALGLSAWNADWTLDDKWTLLVLAAPIIPLQALTNVRTSILRGLTKVIWSQAPRMIVQPGLFLLLILIVFASDSLNTISALSAQFVAILVSFLFASYLLKGERKRFHASIAYATERWKRALLPFAAIAGVAFLNTQLMLPLIGSLATNSEVALFKIAWSLAILVEIPLTIVETIIHPHITRLYQSGTKSKIFKIVNVSGLASLAFSLPLVLIFSLFGQEILKFMYGSSYTGAYLPLVVLSVGFVIVNFIGPSMILLHATEFEKDALLISTGGAIITLILCILWIPSYGVLGAALAFSISKATRALSFRIWARYRIERNL